MSFQTKEEIEYELQILKEEQEYQRSEKSLRNFFKKAWGIFDPADYIGNWHIDCMAEHIQAAYERKIRRLAITIPPRCGKSTLGSIASPAWGWTRDPKEKIWLISHSLELVDQNISGVKTIVKDDWYSSRWCNTDDQYNFKFSYGTEGLLDTRKRFENTTGGYLIGGSPGSKTLGKGYTVAILDDILDSAESYNLEQVDKVNNWYKTTFRNRSNNKSEDVVILIMQRLSEADICAYVEENYPDEDWFKLIIPARYDPKLTFTSPLGSRWNDKRTKPNQLLDPVRLPEEFLFGEEKDLVLFNTRYQQNPQGIAEGNIIKEEELNRNCISKTTNKYDLMLTVWDLNTTKKPKSTYTVGAVLGLTAEGKIELVDMFRQICDITDQIDNVHRMKAKYPQSIIGVENKANGAAILTKMREKYYDHEVIEFDPRLYGGSKEQRYAASAPTIREDRFKLYDPKAEDTSLEPTYDIETIKQELYKFPLSKYNDIVDAISYGLLYLDKVDITQMLIVTGGKPIEISRHLGTITLSQLEHAARISDAETMNAIYGNQPSTQELMDIFS